MAVAKSAGSLVIPDDLAKAMADIVALRAKVEKAQRRADTRRLLSGRLAAGRSMLQHSKRRRHNG
jgi:hypothetical protein